ncbi:MULTISPECIES: helix-turn-helix transcriptional regulator [Streptomyces]|uniref:Transcriptional regulator with XRE-family HTH domain n=1 Tax=Streptomyces stelliscabiei TaxID=146820 RepID=A0A8I0TT42_9ACTN|nr:MULTISPECIES: helix-turn-helix transcriptional regulator [Streptomyces]KND40634.1 XRE family transcriptional regulator [Streptomyces stelliscabiei]KRD22672.1 XRE family transcriptional regulator [Streptomyces sp. Root264]MBE1600770.1 transcriptional regulator with XRE-family HTH domain [Streptomyces stelliscabiei]MDX2519246.1 helix-turn-helix transcriptional regulator [Streptomyces stelliscabiei]MDX2554199.1 helix-turn-helix transcriptional regulator [Streptomyces stelliscabiei]
MDKRELAAFLRHRRETLRPRDVGLVEGPRRRTQGLRREEVAQLAGMSTDYYARLEQQRAPQPSVQITAALARALRLTLDERDHLFVLIGHNAPARFHRSDHVSPTLMRVLDRLDDTPALVTTDLVDTLAMNPLAVALLGDQTRHTGLASSGYYRWFMDPAERLVYPEETHESHGRAQAARLRAALTAGSDTPRAARILAELQEHSPEFVRMWELQEVARYGDCKTLLHPEVGRIDVDVQLLYTENRAQTLVVLTTRPGTESHSKLELLSVIGRQQLTP